MPKMKYWNGSAWIVMDAKDADTLNGKTAAQISDIALTDYTKTIPYAIVTGTANTYAIASPTITALTAGMAVTVKINIASSTTSTLNWDGKGAKTIKKANGVNATNLVAGGVYTLRYDGTNFILQGEGASGNAIASDLLSGKTASTDAGDIVGTMKVHSTSTNRLTPAVSQDSNSTATRIYARPEAGYYDGIDSYTYIEDANFIASNLLAGKTYFGLAGGIPNYTNKENTGYIGAKSARGDGGGTLVIEPYTGYYREGVNANSFGSITVWEPNFIASNLLAGKNYFGLAGGIPNYSGDNRMGTGSWISGTSLFFPVQDGGYYSGAGTSGVYRTDPNFIASNILAGKSIFGLAGTAPSKKYGIGDFLPCASVGLSPTGPMLWERNVSGPLISELYSLNGLAVGTASYGNGLSNIYSMETLWWSTTVTSYYNAVYGNRMIGASLSKGGYLYTTVNYTSDHLGYNSNSIDAQKYNSSGVLVATTAATNYGVNIATSDDSYVYFANTTGGYSVGIYKLDPNSLGLISAATCTLPIAASNCKVAVDSSGYIYISSIASIYVESGDPCNPKTTSSHYTYIWKFNPGGGSAIASYTGVSGAVSGGKNGDMVILNGNLYFTDSLGYFCCCNTSLGLWFRSTDVLGPCKTRVTSDGRIQVNTTVYNPDCTKYNFLPAVITSYASALDVLQTSASSAFLVDIAGGQYNRGYKLTTGYTISL
jgi:hypothetical protein